MRELVTSRLRLRAFEPGDVAAVHAYASDPEVCRHVQWGPNTPRESQEFIDENVAAAPFSDERENWTWAVTLEGFVVGTVSLWVRSREHARGELGYVLTRHRWGQGITTEAAAAALEFGFTDADLARVEATCRPENVGSARVLEKIGMQREGLLRSHMVVRGERRDSVLFAAIR